MRTILIFLLLSASAMAADVRLDWDASTGATGYKISMSTDLGATWQTPVDAGMTKPFTYLNVPEDKMIIFKVAAYNTGTDEWNNYAGAWYDHRLRLSAPVGTGVK
jgi:hypothetical protein